MGAVPQIRVAVPEDWAAVRRVRLAALADAPSAFWSSFEEEVGQSEQQWRERIARGLKLLALDGERVVGHAGGFVPTDRPDDVELVAMWVDPAARGRGIGAALIEALADWAESIGSTRLHLWVEEKNAAAYGLYRRRGFEPTGQRQPMPSGGRWELAMARPVGAAD